jgi:hypothetical protein
MKVVYSKNYVERDLYIIKYKNKYLMVYRSSGLNPGRKGRILPFNFLAENTNYFAIQSLGYIYKEFFYDGQFIPHSKNLEKFGKECTDFLLKLEDYLKDYPTERITYDMVDTSLFAKLVKKINKEIKDSINVLEPFDWKELEKENNAIHN